MKTKVIIIGFIIALITSCASPLSDRLNDYVNEVESSCQNWTEEDWELSQEEYAKLLEDYELGECSPSFAGAVVMNASNDGWLDWKNQEGNAVDIYRKKEDGENG